MTTYRNRCFVIIEKATPYLKKTSLLVIFLLTLSFSAKAEGSAQLRDTFSFPLKDNYIEVMHRLWTKTAYGYYNKNKNKPSFDTSYHIGSGWYNSTPNNRIKIRVKDTDEKVFYGFGNFYAEILDYYNKLRIVHVKNVTYRILRCDGSIVIEDTIPTQGIGYIGGETQDAFDRCKKGPAQVVGDSGYSALFFQPDTVGDYYIEFDHFWEKMDDNQEREVSRLIMQFFDVSVALDDSIINGRLHSRIWKIRAFMDSPISQWRNSSFYVYTKDSTIFHYNAKVRTNSHLYVYSNNYGNQLCDFIDTNVCYNPDNLREALKTTRSFVTSPYQEYFNFQTMHHIFLNHPDTTAFPIAKLTCIDALSSAKKCGKENYQINTKVDKDGFISLLLDFDLNGKYDANAGDIFYPMISAKTLGDNIIYWNGKNAKGKSLALGDSVKIIAKGLSGMAVFPILSFGIQGFYVNSMSPRFDCSNLEMDSMLVYWNDSLQLSLFNNYCCDSVIEYNGAKGKDRYVIMSPEFLTNYLTYTQWTYMVSSQKETFFVEYDTAAIINFINEKAHTGYKDGDTAKLDIVFRGELGTYSEFLSGLQLFSEKEIVNFDVIHADSIQLNQNNNVLRLLLKVNLSDTAKGYFNVKCFSEIMVNSCGISQEFLLPITVQADISSTMPSCPNGDDGSISIGSIRGGNASYYLGFQNQTFALGQSREYTLSGLIAGNYQIALWGLNFDTSFYSVIVPSNNQNLDADILYLSNSVDTVMICEGAEIKLVGNTNFVVESSVWKNNQSVIAEDKNEITVSIEGSVYFNAYDTIGCLSSDSIVIAYFPHSDPVFLSFDDSVYVKQSPVEYRALFDVNHWFKWEVVNGSIIESQPYGMSVIDWNDSPGEASFTLTDSSMLTGCVKRHKYRVIIYQPDTLSIKLVTLPEVCKGDYQGKITAIVSGGEEEIFLRVTDKNNLQVMGNYVIGNPASFTSFGITGGDYFIEAINAFTNDKIWKVNIPILGNPDFSFISNPFFCEGDSAYFEISHEEITQIMWTNEFEDILSLNRVFRPRHMGRYKAYLLFTNGCRDTIYNIIVPESGRKEYELLLVNNPLCNQICDGRITISNVNPSGNTAILYSADGSLIKETSAEYTVNELCAGMYYLEVDNNECSYDTILLELINESCTDIPNLFSPNNDGVNDTWDLDKLLYVYPNFDIQVFNRWGQLVFEARNGEYQKWDGTYRGEKLPIDSYHYVIFPEKDKNPIRGSITIIR